MYGSQHAMAYVNKGKYYGAKASINVWNPKVMNPYEFSLAQIWVTSNANGDFNTVEAGWMVSPVTFGDYRTRLFIYWTADNYQSTGCYNLRCAGFVQTSNEIALGTVVIPISIYGGKQFSLSIHIYKDKITGNWWLQINNKVLGYWPGTLFKGLADSSNLIEWGGEIMNSREEGQHTKTQMGSGHFPNEEWSKSSFIKNIQVVDASYSLRDPDSLTPYAEYPTCYDIKVVPNKKSDYGYYLYFGGPGQSPTCP
ncbi:protein neprosin-like [Magnolia sinica]|uniref:protein neprosin-like n=1 Tax=Magnolia sinica TaxID=86752 RepID=UPI00265A58C2|nr:protein neprosin-like [Magnolia sinica]